MKKNQRQPKRLTNVDLTNTGTNALLKHFESIVSLLRGNPNEYYLQILSRDIAHELKFRDVSYDEIVESCGFNHDQAA